METLVGELSVHRCYVDGVPAWEVKELVGSYNGNPEPTWKFYPRNTALFDHNDLGEPLEFTGNPTYFTMEGDPQRPEAQS